MFYGKKNKFMKENEFGFLEQFFIECYSYLNDVAVFYKIDYYSYMNDGN